jgi:hypothetical protein
MPLAMRFLVILLFAPLVCGCGDGRPMRVPVAGTVLIDGQPLKRGSLRFVPANGRSSFGSLDDQGRFKLTCFETDDGAIIGTHQVEVAASESLSPIKTKWHAPKKYSNYATSGLTQEISGPINNVEINLSWDGGKPYVELLEENEEEGGPRKRAK